MAILRGLSYSLLYILLAEGQVSAAGRYLELVYPASVRLVNCKWV